MNPRPQRPFGPRARRLAPALSLALGLCVTTTAYGQDPSAQPPAVVVAPIVTQDVARSDNFVGRVQAIQSVDLVSRVEGFLEQINFEEGSIVQKDALLIEIEKDQYQASLAAAQAQVAAAKSQLAGAQAQLNNANVVLKRQQDLLKRDVVSQAQADDASAQRDVAQANVEQAQAAIQQAEAQVQTAQINLSYTDIKAPITGRIGATNITQGNLVSASSGTIATIVQVDPIRVAFSVPEKLYTGFAQRLAPGSTNAPGDLFTPQLVLPNGTTYDQQGQISFASNEVSANTGTLVIYADFPNPRQVLLPGAFVNITVKESDGQVLPIVPVSAVLQDKDGRYVFIVTSDNKAEMRRIETGSQIENGFPVTKGLAAGDTVIVQGLQKVRNGIAVNPTRATAQQASTSSSTAAAGATATTAAPAASSAGSGSAPTSSGPSSSGPSSSAPASSASAPSGDGTTAASAPAAAGSATTSTADSQ